MKMEKCPFAGWQLLLVAGSCCLLLINKWQLPLNGCIYCLKQISDVFAVLFVCFDHWKKKLAGVGTLPSWPNPFGVLKTFQVRKWTLFPSLSEILKTKIKIAAWEAATLLCSAPRMVNPSEGLSAHEHLPWRSLESVLLSFHLGCPSYDPCKTAEILEREVGCDPNDKVLFPNHLRWGAFPIEGISVWISLPL